MVTKLGRLAPCLLRPGLVRPDARRGLLSGGPEEEKMLQYTRVSPTPISIAEFLERAQPNKISEAESYSHLVHECLVRLSHMITEVKQFPRELREQYDYQTLLSMYLTTWTGVLEFEKKAPSPENIQSAVSFLIERKARHKDTVRLMASACMAMKNKYGLSLEEEECGLTQSVQYCLDRLYTSRISLNMLTNQHLLLHGHKTPVEGQVGVIHPAADVAAIVRHAFSEAQFLCERCYLHSPALELVSHNLTEDGQAPVSVKHVPSHIYYMTFEVIKNAMQATVNHNWDSLDNLPPIRVLVCQSVDDITIKISDTGGGVDRVTTEKMWKYLYTTSPAASLTSESVPLSGLGLYARYFQGDIKVASYENFGTDFYIYLRALAKESVEKLPIWSDTASGKISATSSDVSDWVGSYSHQRITKKMST